MKINLSRTNEQERRSRMMAMNHDYSLPPLSFSEWMGKLSIFCLVLTCTDPSPPSIPKPLKENLNVVEGARVANKQLKVDQWRKLGK